MNEPEPLSARAEIEFEIAKWQRGCRVFGRVLAALVVGWFGSSLVIGMTLAVLSFILPAAVWPFYFWIVGAGAILVAPWFFAHIWPEETF